jgi:hypothetical protein
MAFCANHSLAVALAGSASQPYQRFPSSNSRIFACAFRRKLEAGALFFLLHPSAFILS